MPYVVVRNPRPFDSTTLNFNWQIWDCNAFSVYAKDTEKIDEEAAGLTIESVLTFLGRQGIIEYDVSDTRESVVVGEGNLFNIKAVRGGLFRSLVEVGEKVVEGQPMAEVIDPYEGEVIETLTSEKMEESFLFRMHHLYWKRHWRLRCLKSNFFLTMQAKYFIIHNIDD